MIGIRLADGNFYPVFDETHQKRRRFILTPANDNQQSVHILFYKAEDDSFAQPQLLGSVNLDNIPPGMKDDRDITIVLGLDADDNLEVSARDEAGGQEHQLILNTHQSSGPPDSSNFFVENEFQLNERLNLPDPGDFIGEKEDMAALHETASRHHGAIPDDDLDWDDSMQSNFVESKKTLGFGVTAALVFVLTSALVGLSFLVFKLIQGPAVPPLVSLGEKLLNSGLL